MIKQLNLTRNIQMLGSLSGGTVKVYDKVIKIDLRDSIAWYNKGTLFK